MSSFSYDRYERNRRQHTRTTFGYWVPLVITATIAAGGLAAWVWSAREEDSSDDDTDLSYGDKDAIGPPRYRSSDQYSQSQGVEREREDGTFIGRVSDVIRRTPSPQQAYDMAKGKVVAGVAAAGAMVGGALSSIREEDRDAFEDHARWSEQAALQRGVAAQSTDSRGAVSTHTDAFNASVRQGPKTGGKRKTVAVVLSAESAQDNNNDDSGAAFIENASILSHLPATATSVNLLVLIYTPSVPTSNTKSRSRRSSHHSTSLGSSYSTVSTPAQTPGEELTSLDPRPDAYTPGTATPSHETAVFRDIYEQARRLVETESQIMTFSTPTGHVHMLRHLGPDVIYMTDALSGSDGANVAQLRDWVNQIVVVVGGEGGGLGGLIDTEDESDNKSKKNTSTEKWWQSSDMVGLGKRVEVVEGVRMAEDFERRVIGRD